MGLIQRGPYAPQRQRAGIDWEAEQAASDASAAQVAEVEALVARNREVFQEESDPLAQLVKRCHAIELRLDALEQQNEAMNEQAKELG